MLAVVMASWKVDWMVSKMGYEKAHSMAYLEVEKKVAQSDVERVVP